MKLVMVIVREKGEEQSRHSFLDLAFGGGACALSTPAASASQRAILQVLETLFT